LIFATFATILTRIASLGISEDVCKGRSCSCWTFGFLTYYHGERILILVHTHHYIKLAHRSNTGVHCRLNCMWQSIHLAQKQSGEVSYTLHEDDERTCLILGYFFFNFISHVLSGVDVYYEFMIQCMTYQMYILSSHLFAEYWKI
jgi:hypothetical protein